MTTLRSLTRVVFHKGGEEGDSVLSPFFRFGKFDMIYISHFSYKICKTVHSHVNLEILKVKLASRHRASHYILILLCM